MLNNIRFWTADSVWRKILSELGAVFVDNEKLADINIDSVCIPKNISIMELKFIIMDQINKTQQNIINRIFKSKVNLTGSQIQIIVLMFQTGGISMNDMKNLLGYSPAAATHTIDTGIYQLRRIYGADFIKNEKGKYYIGKL